MFDALWNLLTTQEEKDTARLAIERGNVTFSDGRVEPKWTAVLDYYRDEKPVQGGGFGNTPDEAYADLVRVVTLGKQHEQEYIATSLGKPESIFLKDEPF